MSERDIFSVAQSLPGLSEITDMVWAQARKNGHPVVEIICHSKDLADAASVPKTSNAGARRPPLVASRALGCQQI
jgi:hypothetical protein